MQSENSIEDQLRICRDRATREGWTIVAGFHDRAISGTTMLRQGLQDLMAMATAGEIDIVLAEAMDRISRDQEDIAHIYKVFQIPSDHLHHIEQKDGSLKSMSV